MVKYRAKLQKLDIDTVLRGIIMKQQKGDAYTMRRLNKITNTIDGVRNNSNIDVTRLNKKIAFLHVFTFIQACIILQFMFSFWSEILHRIIYVVFGTYKYITYLT